MIIFIRNFARFATGRLQPTFPRSPFNPAILAGKYKALALQPIYPKRLRKSQTESFGTCGQFSRAAENAGPQLVSASRCGASPRPLVKIESTQLIGYWPGGSYVRFGLPPQPVDATPWRKRRSLSLCLRAKGIVRGSPCTRSLGRGITASPAPMGTSNACSDNAF